MRAFALGYDPAIALGRDANQMLDHQIADGALEASVAVEHEDASSAGGDDCLTSVSTLCGRHDTREQQPSRARNAGSGWFRFRVRKVVDDAHTVQRLDHRLTISLRVTRVRVRARRADRETDYRDRLCDR